MLQKNDWSDEQCGGEAEYNVLRCTEEAGKWMKKNHYRSKGDLAANETITHQYLSVSLLSAEGKCPSWFGMFICIVSTMIKYLLFILNITMTKIILVTIRASVTWLLWMMHAVTARITQLCLYLWGSKMKEHTSKLLAWFHLQDLLHNIV